LLSARRPVPKPSRISGVVWLESLRMTAVKGLELARTFYAEVVGPSLAVPHTACLVGEGSEVLGYDTERSADHEWGPRVQIFVQPAAVASVRAHLDTTLPESFHGLPTRWFSLARGGVAHHVEVDTAEDWLSQHLPTLPADPDLAGWLAAPQQHLLQLTAGEVFRDDLGELTRRRHTYQWYPDDVWRWIIASQWHLIGNAEPLLGRCVETGDHRGARLLTAHLCRLIMEMAFLQHRRYWPYPKWFGHGFAALPVSERLGSLLDEALDSRPSLRDDGPVQRALLQLAAAHNDLRISESVPPLIADFAVGVNDASRPFPVLNTADLIGATVGSMADARLANLPRVGTLDQLTHGDDQLINFTSWPSSLAGTYRQMLAHSGVARPGVAP
jgi:hypothetical protein